MSAEPEVTRYKITWRRGAYYVSEPNIGDMEVVDANAYDALRSERDAEAAVLKAAGELVEWDTAPQRSTMEEGHRRMDALRETFRAYVAALAPDDAGVTP